MLFDKYLKKHRIPKKQLYYTISTVFVLILTSISLLSYLKHVNEFKYTVPKILHKTTKLLNEGDIQLSFLEECKKIYEDDGWEVMIWYDEDINSFVQSEYPQYFYEFSQMTPRIKQVDAIRYLLMYHYGGIYSDMDAECIRAPTNFINGLQRGSTAWLSGYPEPFFLMSTPGNFFWIYSFELILRDWRKYNVRDTGGPQGLHRMATSYVTRYGKSAVRPFTMYDQSECDKIEPHGDVVCGEPTYRWIKSIEDFQPSTSYVEHKIGFIPNQLVDPTACLARIGKCKNSHCHERVDVQPFFFVHHCLFSWKSQELLHK